MRRSLVWIATLVVIAGMVAGIGALVNVSGDAALEQEQRQLESAVLRAAATCYAVEGYYPATLEKLAEDYGLRYNAEDYIVRYDFFADNVLPDIAVYARR